MTVSDFYPGNVGIEGVEQLDGYLEVSWDDGEVSRFHHIWLRDNCRCAACHDVHSHQKMVWLTDIPPGIAPAAVDFSPGALAIEWNGDGHPSCFDAGWLRANCYSERGRAERRFRPVLWDAASAGGLSEMAYPDAIASAEGELAMLEAVRDHGFVLLRGVPLDDDETEKIARRFGYPTETNWGTVMDVKSEPEAINIASTGHPIAPHTDDSFRYAMPGIEMFHCLEAGQAEGGMSLLVDGFHLGAVMRDENPQAFELLRSVAAPQFALDADTELRARGRIFTVDGDGDDDGDIVGIRYCECTQAALDLPERLIEPYYDALRVLAGMVQRDDLVYRFRLCPGDTLVFDNQRVLHGRTAFDGATGGRRLRNVYVHRDGFHSRLRILGQRLARDDVNRVLPAGAGH